MGSDYPKHKVSSQLGLSKNGLTMAWLTPHFHHFPFPQLRVEISMFDANISMLAGEITHGFFHLLKSCEIPILAGEITLF
jgi:hypothetical protein